MKGLLAGMTLRGRCFLAAALASAACAFVLGERDLLRVAVLLGALPFVAGVLVARTRFRLVCERSVEPPRVPVGTPSTVRLRLRNVTRLPTGVLLAEDGLPYALGGRPRFVLERVEPRGERLVRYTVRSELRGRYQIGPLTVRLTDPFGLVELLRSFSTVDQLTVTPAVLALPSIPLGGGWTGGGDSRPRAVAAAGEDDVAPREYRTGDDLRRVHWRSTARYGELMVRREEQPWHAHGTLFLDGRLGAHRGEGVGSSFEWAVTAAASIGVHLSRERFALSLVTDNGDRVGGADATGPGFEARLLEALAVVTPSAQVGLDAGLRELRRGSTGSGLLVAVLGELTPSDAEALARVRHTASSGIAILLETSLWTRQPGGGPRAARSSTDQVQALLRSTGWRVVRADPRSQLAVVWSRAGVDIADPVPAR